MYVSSQSWFHITFMMSDTKVVMKFELLPDEILLHCFEYFNAIHLFYSFNRLNDRFSHLIRSIRLHINFENVNKTMYDEFCDNISSNPNILDQIYSFRVLNNEEYLSCNTFFSYISLKQLTNLQKFESMIPLLRQLSPPKDTYIHYPYLQIKLTDLLSCKLRILSLPNTYWKNLEEMPYSTTITSVKITIDSSKVLNHLLEHLPQLEYLHVKYPAFGYHDNVKSVITSCSLSLKQLTIENFRDRFEYLERLLKTQTPNLKRLRMAASDNLEIIDAPRWERLITSSLPYLSHFQFIFTYSVRNSQLMIIFDLFQPFQTSFWQKQHHWFTEYILEDSSAMIFTTPYFSDTFVLRSNSQKPSNSSTPFKNVVNLIIQKLSPVTANYFFPNMTSLRFDWSNDSIVCPINIKRVANLYNLQQLQCQCGFAESFLLEIYKETSRLTTLSIIPYSLIQILDSSKLCKYLNQRIRKLYVKGCVASRTEFH